MKNTLMILTAAATMAFAQPPAGAPQAPPTDEVKAYLGLTDAQITSLQTIQQTAREGNASVVASIQTKQQALKALLDGGTTDAAAVGKLVLEVQALNKQIQTSMKAAQAQAVATLTADQKAKLAKLEEAAALRAEIGQAGALGLLTPPAGAGPGQQGGPGAPGGKGPMGMGRRPAF